jgi:two-component system response regulator FixJ
MSDSTVFVIDDDEAVRNSLGFLLRSVDLKHQLFESAQVFLDQYDQAWQGSIILDIRMPGMSGMDLHKRLIDMHCTMPIIFITGHGDIPMAVEAMHNGAFDFIQKPFSDQELLDRINAAIDSDEEHRSREEHRHSVEERHDSLTPREKEVMACVVQGLANKVIAQDLDLSQRTVEIHRARVMQKMKAQSLAELVRMSLF